MKTIAIVNRKGGVGKSTVATHLAGALTIAGSRVLLVDTDPQGNAASLLGLKREAGLFDFLVNAADFQTVCKPVAARSITAALSLPCPLYVLPSDKRTESIPRHIDNASMLRHRLTEASDAFDYIILDTAPTLTAMDGAVMLAADAVIYVTECERLALEGLQSSLDELKSYRHEPRILGIVPNKYRERNRNHAACLTLIRKRFGSLTWNPLQLRTVIAEASNEGRLIYSYAPNSDAARDLHMMVATFQEAISAWAKN